MRLKVIFGFINSKEVSWFQSLHNFPNIIKYLGVNYEWLTYDDDPTGKVDQVLTFSPLMSYDPNYDVACPLWSDLFPEGVDSCECGAGWSSFSWDHMRMCKKWSPW
jgi:hypothetical protein